jgi:hypothetical protein
MEKSEGKSPPRRTRNRRVNNNKINIKLIGCEVVDWVYLASGVVLRLAVVLAVCSTDCLNFIKYGEFSVL